MKNWGGLRLGELLKFLGLPYNISATAEASNFKIGTLLVFAKAHHKIPHRRKSGRGLVLYEPPKILGVPFLYFCNGCAVLSELVELLVLV